jgi:DNA-binding GntR family transcriptional regulator
MKSRDHNLVDLTYSRVKELLFHGRLLPGQKLVADELAGILGVSRTPVREALNRLAQESFLAQFSQRGFYVSVITRMEALDLFDLREALEVLAITRAIERAEPKALAQLQQQTERFKRAAERNATRERALLNLQFHLGIAQLSKNESLSRVLTHVCERLLLKREFGGLYIGRGMTAYEEHLTILEALRTRNVDRAVQAVRKHIQRARASLLTQIDEQEKGLQPLLAARTRSLPSNSRRSRGRLKSP